MVLRTKAYFICVGFILAFSLFNSQLQAQSVPSSETAGGIERQEQIQEKQRALEEKIKQEKKEPQIIEEEEKAKALPEGEKVLITKIVVQSTLLLTDEEIQKITKPFEGKKLTLSEMQKVADLITDALRNKGFVTSRAYLPQQTIGKGGVLNIKIVEGKVGEISIKGAKYFKPSVYKKKLRLEEKDYFTYPKLQRSLVSINESPDRFAKAVLVPGKTPGTTDIVLEVEDKLPLHLGFEYDNFAARSVGQERTSVIFEDNNLLGFDDKLYFKYQRSDESLYTAKNGRYILPLSNTLELWLSALYSRTRLGREFTILDSRGTVTIVSAFFNKELVNTQDFSFNLNFGFDYKRIRNYLLGLEVSRDDLRIFKTGFDADLTDKLGRTLLTAELDAGVPDLWGASSAKDPNSSRAGAGGKFFKGVINFFRLQPMPFISNILWKNTAQFTGYTLAASEQFQIGGPFSVRGYPAAEYSGDRGIYSSLEWTFPLYFLPRKLRVPFTKDNLFDKFRLCLFYDWATTHLNNAQPGEKKNRTLRGAGFGARLNLANSFSVRVDMGYPLGAKPSDSDQLHPWIEFTLRI